MIRTIPQLLLLIVIGFHFQAFSFVFGPSKIKTMNVFMSGRSMEERKMSKKQLFQRVKTHLNEISKNPEYYGQTEVEKIGVELFCESSTDGRQVYDCPYTQFVQLALVRKNILYKRTLVLPGSELWSQMRKNGNFPVLTHENNTIRDPLTIVHYLERRFTSNSLSRKGVLSYEEVLNKTSNFYPALTSFIVNDDVSKELELKESFEQELNLVEGILRSTPGRYLCGIELTIADLYLFPQIFRAIATALHFKRMEIYTSSINPTRPALEKYISHMLDLKEFNDKKLYCGTDKVVHNWKIRKGLIQ